MRSVTVRLDDLRTMILNLGYVGENEHRTFNFDCKKMFGGYPSASVSLTVQPPAGDCYPATVERDGDLVSWTVTDSDLIEEGCGEVQLTFMVGDVKAKTCIGRTKVERSLGATGDIPTPIENWIEQAEEVISEAEAATAAAEDAAEHQPIIVDGYWNTWDADQGAYVSTGVKAHGEDGAAGPKGDRGETGPQGPQGIPGDPTELIDDEAGEGDTDKVWSADKSSELLSQITSIGNAVLSVFRHTAYKDEDGQDAYDALYALVNGSPPTPTHELVSISATFDPTAVVYAWDNLDTLKDNLTVMATYSDSQTPEEVTTGYTLSGNLAFGNCTITVSYEDKTATFTILAYDFVFANGFVNGTNNNTQKKVQVKSNNARILCDTTVGTIPLKDESGNDTIYYAVPIRQDMTGMETDYPQGYRRSMVILEWSESLNDFVQVYSSGWNNQHTKLIFLEDEYKDGNHYCGITFSGANGTEDMTNVDTSEWKVIMTGKPV